jgi:dual specificity phosphatase 3
VKPLRSAEGADLAARPQPLGLIENPAAWWRRLCPVTPQLMLCGDLHENRRKAAVQMSQWVDAGVTHILDVRGEYTDRPLVAELAPKVVYHWVGVHDHGGQQDPEWFDAGVMLAGEAMSDPAARLVVHCHMGINRGPSMALAVLLAQGWDCITALDAIRAARPIAAIIYAADAVAWWHRRQRTARSAAAADQTRVQAWFDAQGINPTTVARLVRAVE